MDELSALGLRHVGLIFCALWDVLTVAGVKMLLARRDQKRPENIKKWICVQDFSQNILP